MMNRLPEIFGALSQDDYKMYDSKKETGPIYQPKKHNVSSYRSQQRKAKKKKK